MRNDALTLRANAPTARCLRDVRLMINARRVNVARQLRQTCAGVAVAWAGVRVRLGSRVKEDQFLKMYKNRNHTGPLLKMYF